MNKRLITIMVMLVMALSTATVSVLATTGAITSVSASNLSSGNKATVKWKASGAVDHYKVGVKTGTTKKSVEAKGSETSKDLTGLKPGEYTFYVEAFDADGQSLGKKETKKYLVLKPVRSFALYPAYKSIALEWKPITGAKYYYVYRKIGSGKWRLIKTISATNKNYKAYDSNNRAYIDKGLPEGKTLKKYTYCVKAAVRKGGLKTAYGVTKKRSGSPVQQMYITAKFKSGASLYAHDPKTGKKIGSPIYFSAGETINAHSYLLGQFKFYAYKNGKKRLFYANEYRLKNKTANYSTKVSYPAKSAVYFANTSGVDSNTKFMVWANFYTQHIYVLKGSKGKWRLYNGNSNNWEISSGVAATPTPAGKFRVKKKWGWHDNVKQWLVFSGGETSIHGKYSNQGYGVPHSHGCIRNPNEKIGYIYNNLAITSRVFTY